MNFLCTYPFLYTAGMCDVTYIEVYNIYLHGKCFLSALYNDIICLAPPQNQHYCLCLATQVHTCMPFLEAVHYAQTDITHTTASLFSFRRPVLGMFDFQSTELGRSWTWSALLRATSCHISFLRMDNQFANDNFTEIFVRHFATT